jgi:hypothetical protein
VERLNTRICGVWVVNIHTGETVAFLRFEGNVQEIFAVQILRNTHFPEMLEWTDERLAHSYVVPDEALADVPARLREPAAKPEIAGKSENKPETEVTPNSKIDH